MDSKFSILFVISVVVLFQEVSALRCLRTDENGPKKNAPCIFPFKYGGIINNQCTNQTDPDGKFWCSTKVDRKGRHTRNKGEWGYCAEGCKETPDSNEDYSDEDQENSPGDSPKKGSGGSTPEISQVGPRKKGNGESNPPDNENPSDPSELGTFLPSSIDECGQRAAAGYIVGGKESKKGDFPFVALLGYNFNGKRIYGCGGALINRRYVLTAAHCQSDKIPIVEVVLGEHDVSKDPDCDSCHKVQRFEITKEDVTVHNDFSLRRFSSQGNDIALIRLPELAKTLNEDGDEPVFPVCLPLKPDQPEPDSEYVVMGWGRTNNERGDNGNTSTTGSFINIQQNLVVPEVPFDECKTFDSLEKITKGVHICYGGEEGKDSCKGDSGGPLIARKDKNDQMFLIGIVSFGTSKCGSGTPGVYTSVKYYLDWIVENLQK